MNNQSPPADNGLLDGANPLPEELSKANEQVRKYNSRMHITSAALTASGVFTVLAAFYQGMYARHTAEKWLHADKDPSKLVSKDELALVDDLRIIAFFAIVIGVSLIGLAKIGCKASWRKNVKFTNVTYKRSLVRFVFVLILACVVRYYVNDAKAITRHHKALQKAQAKNQTAETKFSNKTET
jgi:uncharacterized BrkB/YihY/UPF0761 family membrane protein